MKIIIKESTDSNDCAIERMLIDGKEVANVYPLCECPEDAIIERDLIGCHDIAKFMKLAHDAGMKGEELIIETEADDE